MTGHCIARHVAAPREAVFAVASDFQNAPGRIKAITKLEILTDGPIRAGTRFRETRTMMGRAATEEMEITAYDPPRSYTLGGDSCGCRFRTQLRFEEKNGGTDIVMDFQAQPLTTMARVMMFLMKPMAKSMMKACAKDLDDIAAHAESNPQRR
ncbi:MAG: SRPBCC family protein [Planctomycetes bacterium]|nr:SRPBCC family protein [Planctomycetota bacterium]